LYKENSYLTVIRNFPFTRELGYLIPGNSGMENGWELPGARETGARETGAREWISYSRTVRHSTYENVHWFQAFSVASPTAWNKLPPSIRDSRQYVTAALKRHLKIHLFNCAFT